jgi:hypothetical protein
MRSRRGKRESLILQRVGIRVGAEKRSSKLPAVRSSRSQSTASESRAMKYLSGTSSRISCLSPFAGFSHSAALSRTDTSRQSCAGKHAAAYCDGSFGDVTSKIGYTRFTRHSFKGVAQGRERLPSGKPGPDFHALRRIPL